MSQLPKLPSSVSVKDIAPLSTGASVDAAALTQDVTLSVSLDGPGFKAREVIPASEATERKAFAGQLVRDPGFNALWIAQFARELNLDTGPLEKVLENTRALDAKKIAELTWRATDLMKSVNRHMPTPPNPKFMQAFQNGTAKAQEIKSTIEWLAKQIENAFRAYNDMLAPFTEIKAALGEKYDLMVTAIVLNQQLAEGEDVRTRNITQDTALMEFISLALPERTAELKALLESADDKKATTDEIKRLNELAPLVIQCVKTLNPFIFTGNAAVDRYLRLSNMAGGRAVTLGLFLSAGIARWESDVVAEILTMQQLAVGLALEPLEQQMNDQAARTSSAGVDAVSNYVAFMNRWMLNAKTIQQTAKDAVEIGRIVVDGFNQMVNETTQVSRMTRGALDTIENGKTQFNEKMDEIVRRYNTNN